MNLLQSISEKAPDILGKAGIAGIVTVETANKYGLQFDINWFQVISAAGVVMLIVDRVIRLIWDHKKNKAEKNANT